jgi:hypothetical protein
VKLIHEVEALCSYESFHTLSLYTIYPLYATINLDILFCTGKAFRRPRVFRTGDFDTLITGGDLTKTIQCTPRSGIREKFATSKNNLYGYVLPTVTPELRTPRSICLMRSTIHIMHGSDQADVVVLHNFRLPPERFGCFGRGGSRFGADRAGQHAYPALHTHLRSSARLEHRASQSVSPVSAPCPLSGAAVPRAPQ